jgi:release factor glutamine methyltransferase
MAYILGKREFMSLDFKVDRSVLIPRPDTEPLAESIIAFAGKQRLSMLDVGTGSGCVAVSCAYYCGNLAVDAVDISRDALRIAEENAKRHRVDVRFFQADLLRAFPEKTYDIAAANPPYIATEEIAGLMEDVRAFEPLTALDGGADGLLFYRAIAEKAKVRRLLAFEVGHNQAEAVIQILKDNGYGGIETVRDLSSVERVVLGKK